MLRDRESVLYFNPDKHSCYPILASAHKYEISIVLFFVIVDSVFFLSMSPTVIFLSLSLSLNAESGFIPSFCWCFYYFFKIIPLVVEVLST